MDMRYPGHPRYLDGAEGEGLAPKVGSVQTRGSYQRARPLVPT